MEMNNKGKVLVLFIVISMYGVHCHDYLRCGLRCRDYIRDYSNSIQCCDYNNNILSTGR